MIWEIIDYNNYKIFKHDECEIKVKTNSDSCDIYINYKGYNILMPLGMWGLEEVFIERNITYEINGNNNDMSSWYYSVSINDLHLFVDLICFFIDKYNSDNMINKNFKFKQW